MKAHYGEFSVSTSRRIEVVDITSSVEEIVADSGITNGLCVIAVPHATAAIIVNEYESRLVEDYIQLITQVFKPDYSWKHNTIDNNAHAHLASAIIGSSKTIPVRNGKLTRGTWQNIMLLELDGPRRRRVVVEVLGE